MRAPHLVVVILVLLTPALGATPGIFVGTIYRPADVRSEPGWLFIQGRKGMLRRVEISGAQVVYSKAVARRQRMQDPSQSLTHGVEVQVTAEPDGEGDWRAIRIEILRLPPRRQTADVPRAELSLGVTIRRDCASNYSG
jgi:hypothetical protein